MSFFTVIHLTLIPEKTFWYC